MRRIGRILGQLQKAQLPNRLTCELPEASAAACRGREARRERRERGEQLFSFGVRHGGLDAADPKNAVAVVVAVAPASAASVSSV